MKKRKTLINHLRFVIISTCLLMPPLLSAQTVRVDTANIYDIPEIIISECSQTREVRAAAPTQILTKEQLTGLNILQLSDAVKHFAGVTIKDYGGIGGMKTVSLRSLGAEHTAVGYDGITLTDAQTGQIDIGRFSLDNVDRISLSNGQNDNIFQPARFFASAGVLNIQTLTPRFAAGKKTNLSASFKAGSWGLANPSVLLEQKLGSKWALSVNSEWMSADGKYPYTMHYGSAGDSTSREKRKNTDVETFRVEAGLFGNLSDKEQIRLKTYYYQSSRGLPGATTLYYDYSSQHLWDKHTFSQLYYKKEFSRQWVFQTSAKWNWSYQRYLDPDYKGSEGKTDNSYYQQEYYLSASLLYRVLNNLSFALSSDGSINTLRAGGITNFADPTRYSWLSTLSGKYVNEWFTASASLLATVINDKTRHGATGENHRELTPYITASLKPFANEELRIRFFYKDIFRLPNFNDLYYMEVGNADLSSENTRQYNAGITYSKSINSYIPWISATVDAYYNKVTDKIMAIPTKNIFVWSMVNLGEVEIKGIDAAANISLQPCRDIQIHLSGNHTYQRALDVTDSNGKTYKHQIAYTPRVSGSGQAAIETPWLTLSYSFLHSGKRYALGQNLEENRLKGYSDHSISVSRKQTIKKINTLFTVEVLNILDKNYEIVRYFPMPGRSVRATLKINL